MKYEYDFQDIGLNDDQRKLVELGLVKVEDISARIKEILNARAKDGWEPLYPFSVPLLWFKRIAVTQKPKKK
jgi:hypothetical protein